MALAVKDDEAPYPVYIAGLGADGLVPNTNLAPHPVKQPRFAHPTGCAAAKPLSFTVLGPPDGAFLSDGESE